VENLGVRQRSLGVVARAFPSVDEEAGKSVVRHTVAGPLVVFRDYIAAALSVSDKVFFRVSGVCERVFRPFAVFDILEVVEVEVPKP